MLITNTIISSAVKFSLDSFRKFSSSKIKISNTSLIHLKDKILGTRLHYKKKISLIFCIFLILGLDLQIPTRG
jgi:hypothetical protein